MFVDTGTADWDLMGSIGHELRHAVEVLSNARVTSHKAMAQFYFMNGRVSSGNFETDAAIKTGFAIRAEVRKALRTETR